MVVLLMEVGTLRFESNGFSSKNFSREHLAFVIMVSWEHLAEFGVLCEIALWKNYAHGDLRRL